METQILERAFQKMGARLSVGEQGRWDRRFYSIDIGRDKEGEVFVFKGVSEIDAKVIQVDPKDRHLLLHVERRTGRGVQKAKFLCGHDERHWFVASIPETESVTNINSAKDALRPKGLPKKGNWIRQGEWFFTPHPKEAAKHLGEFRAMVRNATVYVRGEVCHPDHKTVKLGSVWHEVQMNREAESVAMKNMVFLD